MKNKKAARRERPVSLTEQRLAAVVGGHNGTIVVENLFDATGPTSDVGSAVAKRDER